MDQAFLRRVHSDRIEKRQIDELIGLARGIAADGAINQAEAEVLATWLAANASASESPIIWILYTRVGEMLSDGVLDDDEKSELLATLTKLTGDPSELGEELKATTLPLCDPAPAVRFTDEKFCFTGTFAYGCRKTCENVAKLHGGDAGGLLKSTTYLVIGTYVSDAWVYSTYGRKIEKACQMRAKGLPIAIISEDHWVRAVEAEQARSDLGSM
ncbi:BRCT domain-containing protein [Acuticoccus sp. M5D2P5]|uniref:BRCT domain-containing protein n=1 Tax=Acuticoccus kalidii TaxID=2910977 RepID=UPI001F2DCAEF|nr:BRCT domain-containing protein [Acuticoccus kalidii]MCF3935054.1 BRCT domain-containing protein [Acuticoccus kalidii]